MRQTTNTYAAWKVSSNGQCLPLDVSGHADLGGVINRALMFCAHKDVFLVQIEDAVTDRARLEVYRVKQAAQAKRVPHEDGTWRMVKPLLPQFLTWFSIKAFSPVEPWRWTPGADVVGHTDTVEGVAA